MALCGRAIGLTADLECDANKKNEKRELGLALSTNAPSKNTDCNNTYFASCEDDLPKVIFLFVSAQKLCEVSEGGW